jgi:hypothetical protein
MLVLTLFDLPEQYNFRTCAGRHVRSYTSTASTYNNEKHDISTAYHCSLSKGLLSARALPGTNHLLHCYSTYVRGSYEDKKRVAPNFLLISGALRK